MKKISNFSMREAKKRFYLRMRNFVLNLVGKHLSRVQMQCFVSIPFIIGKHLIYFTPLRNELIRLKNVGAKVAIKFS